VTDTPPTILFCLNRSSSVYATFAGNDTICINSLRAGQEELKEGEAPMPKFFINFLVSSGLVSMDDDGQDLPGLEAAEAAAKMSAREILADDVKYASRTPLAAVIITNRDGVELMRIAAKDVLPDPLR
jgi:hypothetical protein